MIKSGGLGNGSKLVVVKTDPFFTGLKSASLSELTSKDFFLSIFYNFL